MVASSVGDDIVKIVERLSSLRDFSTSSTIIEKITRYLRDIKEIADQGDAFTPRPDWLTDATDAVTDLWDLLNDLDDPADVALLPEHGNIITSFFSLCNITFTRRSLLLQLKQIEKLLQRIIAAVPTELGMNYNKRLASSLAIDGGMEVVGRENEKEGIIESILDSTKVKGVVPVVTVVGIQGLGKTLLAKLVCDDERMKDNFDLMIWIDGVHDEYYAESIVKCMIHKAATNKTKPDEKDSIVMDGNLSLGESMRGRRFFLVLDDLRSENREEWLKLHRILEVAASSSHGAVLVTTRNSIVANVVNSQSTTWSLEELSECNSWRLFEQIAEGDPSEWEFSDTLEKMINKCSGVPLAILTMARMLRSCETIAKLDVDVMEEAFMQEMLLIYYTELPSWHLKRCFAHLSLIFSLTEWVNAKTLIRLWMAEGFLGPVNSNSPSSSYPQPEDVGLDCIQEFHRRSIILVHEARGGIMTNCSVGNKLILELSTFVNNYADNVKETVRRVSLARDVNLSYGIPKFLFKSKQSLRTILFGKPDIDGWSSRIPHMTKLSFSSCDTIFSRFKSLRVLNLSDLGIKILPISIGELKYLKYLDLSHNNMMKLPNSIGKLKHLQTLILSDCHQLRELPNGVGDLVSLRHMELYGCLCLTHMPSTVKKLTNLQTLSHFVVSTSNDNKNSLGLGGLVPLNNLRENLEISHLEQLKFKELEQDGHGYLNGKQHIKCLTLKWNHDDNKHEDDDQRFLEHLDPHPNLQALNIVGYRARKFSFCNSSLTNLVMLNLYNCSMCRSLRALDQFPKLKVLHLHRLESLERITDQADSWNESGLGLLEVLSISDCPKLKSWWKGLENNNPLLFGSLSRLEVKHCPELQSMPLYPHLDDKLMLEASSIKPLLETIKYTSASCVASVSPPLSKLRWLKIKVDEFEESRRSIDSSLEGLLRSCVSLQYLWLSLKWPPILRGFKHLNSLESLIITNCSELYLHEDEWEGLTSLRYLQIQEVDDLTSLPEGIKHLTSLINLKVMNCPELRTLTEDIGCLKSLKSLLIEDCHRLYSLPKGMDGLRSLKELRIRNCPFLLPRCQWGTGDDWPLIRHIENVILTSTSEVYE